jgi:hypothetical protein
MKVSSSTAEVVSNISSESIDFSIGSPEMVINIMRNKLYSDKIRVVVQEYLCNARDAMREVGNTVDRIQVTLPTDQEPVLKIRDFGPGLSPERIRDVFVKFGNSTKRSTDTQTGGFGVGAKSAWAYTDAFLIISYYNGSETHYAAHIGSKSTGTLDKISEQATTEKNGVEIQIGVNKEIGSDDIRRFKSAIYRTIAFWGDERPEITNNEFAPPQCSDVTLFRAISKGALIEYGQLKVYRAFENESFWKPEAKIVVDGIVYDAPKNPEIEALINKARDYIKTEKYRLYFFVGNGDVEVSASREALQICEKTTTGLRNCISSSYALIQSSTAKEIHAIAAIPEAKQFLERHKDVTTSACREIKKVVDGLEISFDSGLVSAKELTAIRTEKKSGSRIFCTPGTPSITAEVFIYADVEYKPNALTMRIRKWFVNHIKASRATFVIVSNGERALAEKLGAVNFSEMPGIEKNSGPSISKRDKRKPTEVGVKKFDRELKLRGEILDTKLVENTATQKYIMVKPSKDVPNSRYATIQHLLRNVKAGTEICFPSEKSFAELVGKSGFSTWDEFLKSPESVIGKEKADEIVTVLKKEGVRQQGYNLRPLKFLLPKIPKISDPILVKGLTDYGMYIEIEPNYWQASKSGIHAEYVEDKLVKQVFPSPTEWLIEALAFAKNVGEIYPLITCRSQHEDEIILYINMKYASAKLTPQS